MSETDSKTFLSVKVWSSPREEGMGSKSEARRKVCLHNERWLLEMGSGGFKAVFFGNVVADGSSMLKPQQLMAFFAMEGRPLVRVHWLMPRKSICMTPSSKGRPCSSTFLQSRCQQGALMRKEIQKEPDTRKDSNMLSGRAAMFDNSTMEQCLVTTLGWCACGCKEDP